MALQHADWLGIVVGAVRRGPGSFLDAASVQADIDGLEEIDGEIEDPEGHLAVLDMALIHLGPLWQDLGVVDEDHRFACRRRCIARGAGNPSRGATLLRSWRSVSTYVQLY